MLFCRPIEHTLSASSHASAYESSSVVSGDTEADSLSSSFLREEQETSIGTPADLQIARLEAEAARQLGKRRAPKGRQGTLRRQAAVPIQVRCRAKHLMHSLAYLQAMSWSSAVEQGACAQSGASSVVEWTFSEHRAEAGGCCFLCVLLSGAFMHSLACLQAMSLDDQSQSLASLHAEAFWDWTMLSP